jgi:hypothetical protein
MGPGEESEEQALITLQPPCKDDTERRRFAQT